MTKYHTPRQQPLVDISDGENILSFAGLLYGGAPGRGLDRLATDYVDVSIDLDNDALILTIHDPHDVTPTPTVVTLAGLGHQYAAYDGLHLSDIISGIEAQSASKTASTSSQTRR